MRKNFEDTFNNPLQATSKRFIWDYWNVPEQYTLLRTPAYLFFPKNLYESFHSQLQKWGQTNLGCHSVSPPWLSCYVEGCEQKLHADEPHGPFAFVYSLTPWERRSFNGGETLLLKDHFLDLWNQPNSSRGLEHRMAFTSIPPKFNQLTVFDPRIPHAVNRVSGTHNVVDGRLVIHGWFTDPKPFIEGPASHKELGTQLQELEGALGQWLPGDELIQGIVSFRLSISPAGKCTGIERLAHTLRAQDERVIQELLRALKSTFLSFKFSKKSKGSKITIPLLFEA